MPYYAVLFTSKLRERSEAYERTAARMAELAAASEGFLGMESARSPDGHGITVSYWRDLGAIHRWKEQGEHRLAQAAGRRDFYESYRVRITYSDEEFLP